MTDNVQPWERLPSESGPAWEAFTVYRDLGCSRSLTLVVRRLSKSKQLLARWSRRNSWVERAKLYDAHLDELARAAAEKERIEEACAQAKKDRVLQGLGAPDMEDSKVYVELELFLDTLELILTRDSYIQILEAFEKVLEWADLYQQSSSTT